MHASNSATSSNSTAHNRYVIYVMSYRKTWELEELKFCPCHQKCVIKEIALFFLEMTMDFRRKYCEILLKR